MADSNTELIREGIESLNEGGVEALMPLIHPEFEMVTTSEVASEPDTYSGHDGIRRYFDSFYEAMDEVRVEPKEYIEFGDLVVVPFTLIARGRTTGIELGQPAVGVWEIRDGKLLSLRFFTEKEEAIAEARARSGEESA